MPIATAGSLRDSTKLNDEVWVRWFYISNWSTFKRVNRSEVDAHILEMCSWWAPEFKQKAKFEIVDGNLLREVEAKDV
jgi:hypothetical protein